MRSLSSALCRACGLCCNGVLFHTVRLQAADSAQELKASGMRIEHKKKYDFFDQPCTSFKEKCCSIYEQRPERCRLFECTQLKRIAAGTTTTAAALEVITEAHSKVTHVRNLLQESGPTNSKKPLAKQYERILAEYPLSASAISKELEQRVQLTQAFEALQHFLDKEFRVALSTPLP